MVAPAAPRTYHDKTIPHTRASAPFSGRAETGCRNFFEGRPPPKAIMNETIRRPIIGKKSTELPVERLRVETPAGRRTGCPFHDVRAMLREVGLRPTRQRLALGWLLFAKGDRHLSAEMLHEDALRARFPVSLATVYNTLNQFTEVGLLREVAVDGSKTYFDTNASDHHHFYVEGDSKLLDIPDAELMLGKRPTPPEGYEVARIEVIVRLRRKQD
jgi:Fur family transcriptional regulator, iron response regulator